MKKLHTIALLFVLFIAVDARAQKVETVEFRQSQSRISEPKMELFVRPLIVDLELISQTRVEDSWSFPNVRLTELTNAELQNIKATALYQSSDKYKADVMVAATFDVSTPENNRGYGINIKVIGYPARYTNWRSASEKSDYEWIKDVYGNTIGVNAIEAQETTNTGKK